MLSVNSRKILFGAGIAYLTILINICTGILYTPWMINQLGRGDHGLYNLVISILTFLSLDFGLGIAVSRFVSKYRLENDNYNEGGAIYLIQKLYLIIATFFFVILLGIYFFLNNIYAGLTPLEISKLKHIYIIVGFASLISFPFMPMKGIIISYEKFPFLKLSQLFVKIAVVLITAIVLLLGFGLYGLIVINAMAVVTTSLINIYYVKKHIKPPITNKYRNPKLLKEIIYFSGYTTISLVSERVSITLIPSIIGIMANTIQISIYAVGQVFSGYVATISNALNSLFLPKVTKLSLDIDDISKVSNLMIKIGRIQLAIVGILQLGIVFMGKEFIIIWVGQRYINSYYIAVMLISTLVISQTQNIGETALIVYNKVRYQTYISIFKGIIILTFALLLTHYYGAIGVGISILMGDIFFITSSNYIYKFILKIDIRRFFIECHLKYLFTWALTALLIVFIQYAFPTQIIIVFLLKVLAVLFIYLSVLYVSYLNQNEKSFLSQIFSKLINKTFKHYDSIS